MRNAWLGALLLACAAGLGAAGVDPALPRYEPRAVVVDRSASYVTPEGSILVTGYNDMGDLIGKLVPLFTASHSGVRFALDLRGTRFAPAALASGASAFAPMGAEFSPAQLADYRARARSDPIEVRVAHASVDPRALSAPLAIFVHRDNPLASLTLEQVERTFTGEATRWTNLGVAGEFGPRSVHLYGLAPDRALAFSLRDLAMHQRPFAASLAGFPQSTDVVRHVAADPSGIGFAAAMRATASVRVIAIARHAGEEPVAPTEDNIMAGRYPLDRYLLVYARRPLEPVAREFLRLMLSREGQEAVAATPQKYLPLSAREAALERSKLE